MKYSSISRIATALIVAMLAGCQAAAPAPQQAATQPAKAQEATKAPAEAAAQAKATPQTVNQASAPAAPVVATSQAPGGGFAAPSAGPNLLSKNWSERLGVLVSEMQPVKGQPILNPKAGDLWFFSNSSTTWGATNTKNSVWVIDAKTRKTIAEYAPPGSEGYSSHGMFISADVKYIYLPQLGKVNHIDVLDGRTMEIVQKITTLGRPHHHKLWEDPISGKSLIIGEDFNWSMTGSGVYVFDPSQNNAVVGGMSNGDFQGNPYVTTPSPDGKFIIVTVPAPMSAFRDKMDGYVAKVDPKTWKVVGMYPMKDPLWAEVSLDGKYAYVTSGGEARVHKVNLDTMEEEGIVQTGPGPWGARLNYDNSKLYTADKGEGPGYNQLGRTSTVIDLSTLGVSDVLDIGLTTDHAIMSPDGSEMWFTSNAEHNIHVYNTKTLSHEIIQDPADGDIHGGIFVQYSDDGKGGVKGEVVSDYSGLHGSALKAQREYAAKPKLEININRNGFLQKSINADAGKSYRLIVKNVAGTSAGKITFDSADLGIKGMVLTAGDSQEVQWTAPASGEFTAKTNDAAPNKDLKISVKTAAAAPTPNAPASDVRVVKITTSQLLWDIKALEVKPGEKIRFEMKNGDDEKHNLVGVGEGTNLLSPDIAGGATGSYMWTAPDHAMTFTVVCAYHPAMQFVVTVK